MKSERLHQATEVILQKLPETMAIYLFGSTGSLHENNHSDLDLAILAPTKIDPLFRWNLAQEIAFLVKRDVDLIDLAQSTTVLQFQIISTGKRVFYANLPKCILFEALVYTMYIKLNEERRE